MNRIKQISNLIHKCQCVFDVGSDHALLAIDLLKNKKVKQVVNIEKRWQPFNAGKENLAKNHLTTKTINVLNDGLKDICKKVFVKPNYIVIAGLGAKTIIEILENKDSKIAKDVTYILEANCDVHELRKYLTKNKYSFIKELTCIDRTKFYQIICVQQGSGVQKMSTFESYYGFLNKQEDKLSWTKFLKAELKKITSKKLNKFNSTYAKLYKELKVQIKK